MKLVSITPSGRCNKPTCTLRAEVELMDDAGRVSGGRYCQADGEEAFREKRDQDWLSRSRTRGGLGRTATRG